MAFGTEGIDCSLLFVFVCSDIGTSPTLCLLLLVACSYDCHSDLAKAVEVKPTVAWIEKTWQGKYAFASAAYKLQLLADTGVTVRGTGLSFDTVRHLFWLVFRAFIAWSLGK